MMVATLLPQHLEDFRKSGITDESVAKYDISSVNQNEASEALGFRPPSGGWALRYPGSEFFKFKPDKPFNKEAKYLSPKDTAQELFITHLASGVHGDTSEPYYFCEGEKKCLALEQAGYAAIGVSGVWNWKSRGHVI